ncbi:MULTISPECIES: H-NS histone family protein [unclassified Bradyrhizobium]|uniref:H-NS histone family protein n=1 Tax=unclassified Bradyrhizobium TaxID=2631580 RepID=UPI001029F12A|nr:MULTISPECIES: H-NS histone family protein [unclassified Bradyrhizobium]RZN10373.1 histidinol phosphate phosphatase [Bradyrhizobium sp. Leo121]TAI59698.1 histidinol phosphate phosphatase [Bradyrhizobium sp. Leo170]
MKRAELERMTVDELWSLHVEVSKVLQQKIRQEKLGLDDRLRQLVSASRLYPLVSPKYQNPDQPSQTWTGRGKQPRWLVAQLKLGKRIDDFKVQPRIESRDAARSPQSGN